MRYYAELVEKAQRRGRKTVKRYAKKYAGGEDEFETTAGDLIADILHAVNPVDVEAYLDRARHHYEDECTDARFEKAQP